MTAVVGPEVALDLFNRGRGAVEWAHPDTDRRPCPRGRIRVEAIDEGWLAIVETIRGTIALEAATFREAATAAIEVERALIAAPSARAAFQSVATPRSGTSVVYLICSIAKLDDTSCSSAVRMSCL